MKATAILHDGKNNYQLDYFGHNKETCVSNFGEDCIRRGIVWGHLFYEVNGELLGSFIGNPIHG